MGKHLIVFGNPFGRKSAFATSLARAAEDRGLDTWFLDELVSEGSFPIAQLQAQISQYDGFVIHAPVYWYSAPALVKAWMDQMLTPGWAFPSEKSALAGKRVAMSLTVGAAEASYAPGQSNRHDLGTYFLPFEQAFRYCGMHWMGLVSAQVPSASPPDDATGETQLNRILALLNAPT